MTGPATLSHRHSGHHGLCASAAGQRQEERPGITMEFTFAHAFERLETVAGVESDSVRLRIGDETDATQGIALM